MVQTRQALAGLELARRPKNLAAACSRSGTLPTRARQQTYADIRAEHARFRHRKGSRPRCGVHPLRGAGIRLLSERRFPSLPDLTVSRTLTLPRRARVPADQHHRQARPVAPEQALCHLGSLPSVLSTARRPPSSPNLAALRQPVAHFTPAHRLRATRKRYQEHK